MIAKIIRLNSSKAILDFIKMRLENSCLKFMLSFKDVYSQLLG